VNGLSEPRDPKVQRDVEARLSRRLEDYVQELLALGGPESEKAPADSSAFLARGLAVARWADALEAHCQRVLADVVAFQSDAEDVTTRAWLVERFGEHVDRALRRTTQTLATVAPSGFSTRAVQNRLANLATSIKNSGRSELEAAVKAASVVPRAADADAGETEGSKWDDLLPLRRRGDFDRDLDRMTTDALATQDALSLVMVDLDHFKSVNDTHGHPVGDEVLLAVAQRIVKRLGRKGRAYRYGGEEIALLLPTYSWEEAQGLAERIRKDLAGEPVSSKELVVTASFGVACVPDHAADGRGLLQQADQALYRAKATGRNCVVTPGHSEPEPDLDEAAPRGDIDQT
jgi:diguanylate cyclase (GGDEF)-like protein